MHRDIRETRSRMISDQIGEVIPGNARDELCYFAPGGRPSPCAFRGSALAATILVMIDKHRQGFDSRQNWKLLEVPGITDGPSRRQDRVTMLHTRRGSERRLDPLANNEAALHLVIGPQPNHTAGIWSQCLATDLRAGIGNCGPVNRPWLTAYSVGP
jgi:hypothetical protein